MRSSSRPAVRALSADADAGSAKDSAPWQEPDAVPRRDANWNGVRRARPLLGTRVAVAVGGLPEAAAHAAIDDAFAAIGRIEACMSYHRADSDVTRLNRAAPGACVPVDPDTHAVLAEAVRIAALSDGAFDPTVAGALVAGGVLVAPADARPPDPAASWRDLALLPGHRVRLERPLWLDLGGIAKGYAVDRALAVLAARGATRACVEAGGDLRVMGPDPERVALRTAGAGPVATIALTEGALASSSSRPEDGGAAAFQHRDGADRRRAAPARFACVVAETCIRADALTKVVLVRGAASRTLLDRLGAAAYLQEADGRWRSLGRAAA